MKYIYTNVIMKQECSIETLKKFLINVFKFKDNEISNVTINKKSIDTRVNKGYFVYSLIFETTKILIESKNLKIYVSDEIEILPLNIKSIVVVGAGPSGLFFSLLALERGIKVTLIERGKDIEERIIDCNKLIDLSILDKESNNLYGLGGAGTFSDGKLGTQVKSKYTKYIYKQLIKFGAKEEILEDNSPHIGTDILRKVVSNIKEYLIKNGVNIYFSTKFIGFNKTNDKIRVNCISNSNEIDFECEKLVLAFGSSDINNYKILLDNNITLEPKDYSIGVRIEHLRNDCDRILNKADKLYVESKSYKYFAHLEDNRVLYTFCMCPGGFVIPTPTEENTMVVNGMSYSKRNNINSNSALLVNVRVNDYYKSSPLDGITFRKIIEEKAFNKEFPYSAPIQKLSDFYENKITEKFGKIKPSITNYYFGNLNNILPDFIVKNIKIGIKDISKRFSLFEDSDAILTGVETRSSSPLFIKRISNFETSLKDIYAIGDGSGYSGGITSAIIDAIKLILSF